MNFQISNSVIFRVQLKENMKIEFKSNECDHQKRFNSNDELISVNLLSNCKSCFLKEFLILIQHRNIQINNIKLIGKPYWIRDRKNNRLKKMRNVFWRNQKCRSFGLGCDIHFDHKNRLCYQTNTSFNPFPIYKGETDRMYKSRLCNKYFTMKTHMDRIKRMDWVNQMQHLIKDVQ